MRYKTDIVHFDRNQKFKLAGEIKKGVGRFERGVY